MGLNYAGPLIGEFFSIVNTTALHTPRVVESADGEPRIQRVHSNATCEFSTAHRAGAPDPCCSRTN